MAFCSQCGTSVKDGASFCGSCGARVLAPAVGAPTVPPIVTPAASSSAISSNVVAVFAYVLTVITGLIFLLVEPYKNDKFVRFHALQSILFYLAAIGVWGLFALVASLLGFITFGLGAWVMLPVSVLLALGLIAYWVFLMYKAYGDEFYQMPYLGAVAASASESPALAPNVVGFLAYVLWFITGVVFLIAEPYKHDKFVRFHALQSIFFSIVYIGFSIVWGVLTLALSIATYGTLWHFLLFIWLAVRVGFYLGWIFLMIKAYKNERFMLPIIGALAAKQAG
jgi:uncharacterized membrane protein